jgi:hypothetical protein
MPHQIKVFLDNELLVIKPIDISKTCQENQSRTSRSTTPDRRNTPNVNRSTTPDRRNTPNVNRSTTPQKRSVVIIDKKDLRKIPYQDMILGMRYYYIDDDDTIKRGAYIKFDETNQRRPYIIQKDPEFSSQGSQYAFVDSVYLRVASSVRNPQTRSGGKKRRTRRGKKSSRKSRKSRK